MRAQHAKGFTLIEALVVIAIGGIVTAFAVPSFQGFLGERRVFAAAADYAGSLRVAQAEAIRRNRSVEVLFTSTEAIPANTVSATAVSSTSGRNRVTRVVRPSGTGDWVQGSNAASGGPEVNVDAGAVRSIAFTPIGRPIDYTVPPGSPLAGLLMVRFTDAPTGRRVCTLLSTAGSVRVCDPTRPAGDAYACPSTLPEPC